MSYPNVTLLIPGPICPENSSVWMIKLSLIKTQYIVIIFSHSTFSYLHHPTSENIPLSSCYSTPCDFFSRPPTPFSFQVYYMYLLGLLWQVFLLHFSQLFFLCTVSDSAAQKNWIAQGRVFGGEKLKEQR